MITWAMRRMIRPAVTAAIPAVATAPRPCSPIPGRWKSPCPGDRDSGFEPEIVATRQRRLTGVDDMVLSLSAAGLTHGQIGAHLAGGSGAEVSGQMITAITDRVREGPAGWPSGPPDPVSAVIFIDAIARRPIC